MRRAWPVLVLMVACSASLAEEATVAVRPPDPAGTRLLKKQTADAVIQDYLQSWKSLSGALDQNRAALLTPDFVGTALTRLEDTIEQQTQSGLHIRYQDRSHEIRIESYSPDGLSVRLTDDAAYSQQTYEHDKLLASELVKRRYIVVLTPSEVRWQIRIFQTAPDAHPAKVNKTGF